MTIGTGVSIPGFHQKAASINVIAGTPVGTVADIQTWQDGNTLDIQEAAATPGQNVEITFNNVSSIRRVGLSAYYAGSATHWLEIQLWNDVESAWEIVWTFSLGFGINYRYSDIPKSGSEYIDGSGVAKMRIYHPASGNAAHDTFIDYATLIT